MSSRIGSRQVSRSKSRSSSRVSQAKVMSSVPILSPTAVLPIGWRHRFPSRSISLRTGKRSTRGSFLLIHRRSRRAFRLRLCRPRKRRASCNRRVRAPLRTPGVSPDSSDRTPRSGESSEPLIAEPIGHVVKRVESGRDVRHEHHAVLEGEIPHVGHHGVRGGRRLVWQVVSEDVGA